MTSHMFVCDPDIRESLLIWAEDLLKVRFFSDAQCFGVMHRKGIGAVVVYDRFSDNDCVLHLASDGTGKWMTKEFLLASMHYPFNQCGLARITCMVAEDNKPSMTFTRTFGKRERKTGKFAGKTGPNKGWFQEGRLRRAGPDGQDLILFGMLREECPYITPSLV